MVPTHNDLVIFDVRGLQIMVGNEVESSPCVQKVESGLIKWVICEGSLEIVDSERDQQVLRGLKHIIDREIQQHFVSGFALLQNGLAARDIGVELGKVVPEA